MKESIFVNGIEYKVGDVIIIDFMKGEPAYKNRTGNIITIDDLGQIHGTWGGLALAPEVDVFRKVE